ncbi:hypothetical protein K9N68_33420 [Kovacikia minuta CCNUW1]|uniref:surface-adhesin E family protein n=1 Tax=Kovacikia minuta TaxID=2931930 RepID=UPI001CCB88C0|nr:surface-adhesin E family protein [Kovacikia minuta]UBF26346.1 hypothetical protein K9N68_33420 [Kovacikia minuta CCNUW1]
MQRLLPWLIPGLILFPASTVLAADWVIVTTNSVGDQFFVDKSSIRRNADTIRYWEYRKFPQPNNAFLEETVSQPVYGTVIHWSVDCQSQVQRLRQVTAYNQDRQVIQKFSYGDSGSLAQPKAGSSAQKVVEYVCRSPEQ